MVSNATRPKSKGIWVLERALAASAKGPPIQRIAPVCVALGRIIPWRISLLSLGARRPYPIFKRPKFLSRRNPACVVFARAKYCWSLGLCFGSICACFLSLACCHLADRFGTSGALVVFSESDLERVDLARCSPVLCPKKEKRCEPKRMTAPRASSYLQANPKPWIHTHTHSQTTASEPHAHKPSLNQRIDNDW